MQKSVFRRAIILSWICLVVCFIIKLFGGNWFEIAVIDGRFIKAGNYIDTNIWVSTIITSITNFIGLQLFLLAICRRKSFGINVNARLVAWAITQSLVKYYIKIGYYGFILDVIQFVAFPCLLLGKPSKKYWHILLANVLNIAFQLIPLFVKNIDISIIDSNSILSLIFLIDYYIMLTLFYLYSQYLKKGGVENNG